MHNCRATYAPEETNLGGRKRHAAPLERTHLQPRHPDKDLSRNQAHTELIQSTRVVYARNCYPNTHATIINEANTHAVDPFTENQDNASSVCAKKLPFKISALRYRLV